MRLHQKIADSLLLHIHYVLVLVILFYCKIIDIYYLLKNIFIEYDTGDPILILSRNFTILAKPWAAMNSKYFPRLRDADVFICKISTFKLMIF